MIPNFYRIMITHDEKTSPCPLPPGEGETVPTKIHQDRGEMIFKLLAKASTLLPLRHSRKTPGQIRQGAFTFFLGVSVTPWLDMELSSFAYAIGPINRKPLQSFESLKPLYFVEHSVDGGEDTA